MNELERHIRDLITHGGPLSIAEYMTLCLTHPKHGYYTSGLPIGGDDSQTQTGGDFITAPEVSQMFGELVAVWCMQVWELLDCPSPFNLVEIGPGRGTLMKDVVRASRALPKFHSAMQVHLIEVSQTLKAEQQNLLSGLATKMNWHPHIDELPDGPTILFANELLDTLPFRQWVKTKEGWLERGVGLSDEGLSFALRANRLDGNALPKGHEDEPEGMIFETAPAREAFISSIGEQLKTKTGAALFIDYGHLKSDFGDTFQAVRGHKFADALIDPGANDLTSHVDFGALYATAQMEGCAAPEPTSQGAFLLQLGLLERAGSLGRGKSQPEQDALHKAVERLAGPDQMGELFKVLTLGNFPNEMPTWPGFD